jgi:lipoprotein-releasing system permease protein
MTRVLVFLALSQLRARPWQSLLLVFSVSLGVAILTTALSLTNGFEKDLVNRLLGTSPHVSVYEPLTGKLKNYAPLATTFAQHPQVQAVTPYIQGQGLLTLENRQTVGVLIRGVDPEQEIHQPTWKRYLIAGELAPYTLQEGVVLGVEVARKMGLTLGDQVSLVTGAGKRHRVKVTGLFESGLYEFDAHIAFVTLRFAQKAFDFPQAVSGLGLTVKDVFQAQALAGEISRTHMLGARSWADQNRPLLQAMFLERVVIFIVVMFIVLVALMGIGSTMAMWVIEKNREISLLRALGISARDTGRLFMLQGSLIATVGVVLGSFGGVVLSSLLAAFPMRLAGEVYFLSHLPVDMQLKDFALVAVCTLVLSPVASLMPARRAMTLDPIAIIRRT